MVISKDSCSLMDCLQKFAGVEARWSSDGPVWSEHYWTSQLRSPQWFGTFHLQTFAQLIYDIVKSPLKSLLKSLLKSPLKSLLKSLEIPIGKWSELPTFPLSLLPGHGGRLPSLLRLQRLCQGVSGRGTGEWQRQEEAEDVSWFGNFFRWRWILMDQSNSINKSECICVYIYICMYTYI